MNQRIVGLILAGFAILSGFRFAAEARGDVAVKVKPSEVVNNLNGAKIISVQDVDKISAIDQEGMRGVWGNSPVNEYDRNYAKRLKEFLGIELVIVRSGELLEEMGKVEESSMEKLADTWIREDPSGAPLFRRSSVSAGSERCAASRNTVLS